MSFIRLNITAEGQTEEMFANEVLSYYLGGFNISTDVRCVKTGQNKFKTFRGGLINYEKAKNDIKNWLKEDMNPECRFSTMFDYYALPNNFPKYEEAQRIQNVYEKIDFLENAFTEDIGDIRFIPYIQLHEFEALILAKPENLAYEYFDYEEEIKVLNNLLKQKDGNSELINDAKETAPSKQIVKLIPEYDKVAVGSYLAGLEGIPFLKEKCPHFGKWITKLENLNKKP